MHLAVQIQGTERVESPRSCIEPQPLTEGKHDAATTMIALLILEVALLFILVVQASTPVGSGACPVDLPSESDIADRMALSPLEH